MKSTRKFLISNILILTIFLMSFSNVFATQAPDKNQLDLKFTKHDVEQFTKSLTTDDYKNPYLRTYVSWLNNLVSSKGTITLSELNSLLSTNENYKNFKSYNVTHAAPAALQARTISAEDKKQLERVDKLAQEYYDYYKIHGKYPDDVTQQKNGTVQAFSFLSEINILKGLGLSYSEKVLASRLATLGGLALLDGPLPVLDFIALVGAVVVISDYAAKYVESTTVVTNLTNNISTNEGTQFRKEVASSLSQTTTVVTANRNKNFVHFAASPKDTAGGGINIITGITLQTAILRAQTDKDTYSPLQTDAYKVASGATPDKLVKREDAHINTPKGYQPLNKPHYHVIMYGTQTRGHHWYN
ncbi:hypothetical protein I6N90_06880 [Paenibacillus sp. GSMTC-2017]|uniref:hypothetical protein n=1 Tax=Paenibacillus sp. GSMTC-2017 TaxID=2794350 RepID=UPI0018D62CEB|nr:hypothetical protein [Paenibacillus sp. GSMTC-2017]MBH5317540.1 hypothetical protein [Paenibacillus sp. GSMTC-2017]